MKYKKDEIVKVLDNLLINQDFDEHSKNLANQIFLDCADALE